jgi:hypothetical protein
MFLPACPSGSITPRTINTTWQPTCPTGAPTHGIATFKPNGRTAIQGVAGQTFVGRCPTAASHGGPVFQAACPTGDLGPA